MKKLAFLTLAIVAAAGCSGAGDTPGGQEGPTALPSDGVSASQIRAFKSLELSTKRPWLWLQHDKLKTPMHLSAPRVGQPLLLKRGDAVYTTISLLKEHRDLFKMRDPSVELIAKKTEVDDLGMTHARFQQMVRGVPVAGAELIAHYDAVGHIASIDANYIADLHETDVQPTFPAADALALVKADILSRTVVDEGSLEPDAGKLVVYAPTDTPAKLAYEYKVRAMAGAEPAIWVTTVDAKTGRILHQYNNLQTVQGQGAGVLGDAKKFEVTDNGGTFVMADVASGADVLTYTANQGQTTPGTLVSSLNPNSWDTGVPGAGAAVDAHVNAAAVLKYYKDKQARNAIDGAGGPLISTTHFARGYDNAAWDGTGMIYGDGNVLRALSAGLDVVGHEFTHGVTEKTSNLAYESQPGALNEAVSDILGAFIEHSVKPDPVKNWLIGESLVKTGPPLRDMMNPGAVEQPQPSHMTKFVNTLQDNGGVHINSGIINNAAYLMTVGGVNPVSKIEVKFGIGWEKSEKLWYRADTKYFIQSTSFGQAALGVLQAAKDIGLTENETNIVDCAFKATGVAQGVCAASVVDPKATTPAVPTSPAGGASSGDTGDGSEDGTTPAETPAPPAPKRRRAIVTEEGGCNATGGGSNADFGGAAIVALVLGLATTRRKKR